MAALALVALLAASPLHLAGSANAAEVRPVDRGVQVRLRPCSRRLAGSCVALGVDHQRDALVTCVSWGSDRKVYITLGRAGKPRRRGHGAGHEVMRQPPEPAFLAPPFVKQDRSRAWLRTRLGHATVLCACCSLACLAVCIVPQVRLSMIAGLLTRRLYTPTTCCLL